ncbi:COG0535 Predicted Fe-S oxidoreductases [uncultured Caudovirales phage]|uniref:COG0535 Predicted Fe-S oxidoreductases n=1 Tax=uncultured Caudovirales phage TaxID=2100421 RepID=A0A6J5LKU3_9CAUD|nr:COG0535 Predicted Fe-S oxidoreductases [uncultured Caudovirales phage]
MELPKTICMLPWISIETSPIGTARPCCLAREEITKEDGTKFDLNKDNLETIYHSEYMQNLRRQFRAGEKPETCKLCWDEEAADRTSKRIHSRVRLKELYTQVDWMNDDPDQLWFLDLKLGNICNLKCRICGSWSSSKWADEELKYMPKEFDKKTHIAYQWLKQGAWPRNPDTNFWENLKQLLPNIKYLEFTGGEPFLIQEHFDLLKFAVEQGYSKNIDIHYNTNGTVDPDDSWLWQHFGRVDIAFSIDNVGDRFEYERYGAKWDEVNDNIVWISSYKQHNDNITTQLCFTVNIQNVYYLDELLAWADRKGFDNIYFNMMHSPDHMSIQKMTPAAQELVLNKLKTTFWTSDFYQREIDSIIKFIENGTGSDGAEFLEKMQRADEYRKQNFMDTHPEIAKAMGYE